MLTRKACSTGSYCNRTEGSAARMARSTPSHPHLLVRRRDLSGLPAPAGRGGHTHASNGARAAPLGSRPYLAQRHDGVHRCTRCRLRGEVAAFEARLVAPVARKDEAPTLGAHHAEWLRWVR